MTRPGFNTKMEPSGYMLRPSPGYVLHRDEVIYGHLVARLCVGPGLAAVSGDPHLARTLEPGQDGDGSLGYGSGQRERDPVGIGAPAGAGITPAAAGRRRVVCDGPLTREGDGRLRARTDNRLYCPAVGADLSLAAYPGGVDDVVAIPNVAGE